MMPKAPTQMGPDESGDRGTPLPSLPLMKTREDAMAACAREHDPFYLDAFMIEGWLGSALLEVVKEYAEKKSAGQRQMQTGQAWRCFLQIFGHVGDNEFHHVYSSLLRFAGYNDVQAKILRRACVP